MVLTDTLPSDSVLRRHAESERNRVLGWPPTDSVLRRHHEQWLTANAAPMLAPPVVTSRATAPASSVAQADAPAARSTVAGTSATPSAARAPAAASRPGPAAHPAAASSSGGLFGWLRRVLGL